MFQKIIIHLSVSLLIISTFSFAEEVKKSEIKATSEKSSEKKNKIKKSHEHKNKTKDNNKKSSKKKSPKVHYYPKASKTVVLGKEKYQKNYKVLKGLKAVHIDLAPFLKELKKRNLKAGFDVKKKVVEILKKHKMSLLNTNQVKYKFGQPTLNLSISFPAHLGPYKKNEKHKKIAPCCSASVSGSYTEGGRTLRQPKINTILTLWKGSEQTKKCDKLDKWFAPAVLKVVKKFIADKEKAEKNPVVPKKKIVKKKEVVKKKPIVHKKQVVKKKTVVKKKEVVKYVGNAGLQRQVVNHKTVKHVSVHKEIPKVVHVAPKVVHVAPKEVTCSTNEILLTPKTVIGSEFYQKVISYERVGVRPQVVNYEVVRPVSSIRVANPQPRACSQIVNMEIELFPTNSSRILSSKYFILDSLADKIDRCFTYTYTIETHADQRGSDAYNDRLTKERAASISRYLIMVGINRDRFETRSFGKRKLVTVGTTSKDYSKNRRVVVIPHKIK